MKKPMLLGMIAALTAAGTYRAGVKYVHTGGHRNPGYSPTSHDLERIAAAQARRERRAAKRYGNHVECLANNRCLR